MWQIIVKNTQCFCRLAINLRQSECWALSVKVCICACSWGQLSEDCVWSWGLWFFSGRNGVCILSRACLGHAILTSRLPVTWERLRRLCQPDDFPGFLWRGVLGGSPPRGRRPVSSGEGAPGGEGCLASEEGLSMGLSPASGSVILYFSLMTTLLRRLCNIFLICVEVLINRNQKVSENYRAQRWWHQIPILCAYFTPTRHLKISLQGPFSSLRT